MADRAIGPTGSVPIRVSLNMQVFVVPSVTDAVSNVDPLFWFQ